MNELLHLTKVQAALNHLWCLSRTNIEANIEMLCRCWQNVMRISAIHMWIRNDDGVGFALTGVPFAERFTTGLIAKHMCSKNHDLNLSAMLRRQFCSIGLEICSCFSTMYQPSRVDCVCQKDKFLSNPNLIVWQMYGCFIHVVKNTHL